MRATDWVLMLVVGFVLGFGALYFSGSLVKSVPCACCHEGKSCKPDCTCPMPHATSKVKRK